MKIKHALSVLFASCLLAACSDEPPPSAAPQPTVRKPDPAKPADPTARMARAYSQGKPTAPVDLKYEVSARPEPGKDIEVELAFILGALTDSMTFNIASGTPGLEVVANATGGFTVLKSDEIVRHKVVLRGERPEVYYFTVSATLTTAGTNSNRTFSIPLIFSDPGAAPGTQTANATTAPQAKPDASGQKVESMPAVEKK